MTTNPTDSTRPASAAAPKTESSPLRLAILCGVLLAVIAAALYDYFSARPAAIAANDKIQAFVDERNKLGVKDGSIVTAADIHKELGMQPTSREVYEDKDYEIEYYRWWGHVPMFGQRRHFVSVVYLGKEPRRFSSHYLNEIPPDEALPISQEPGGGEGITLGQPDNAAPAAADPSAQTDDGAATAPPAADAKAADEKAADPKAAEGKTAAPDALGTADQAGPGSEK